MKNPGVTWQTLDWAALDRLRELFLAGSGAGADYWTSPADLANYEFTYAQRIGWKWDAVLRELALRGWTPPPDRPLIDWGCGSGMAGRRVLEFFGKDSFVALRVCDHSTLAMEFAADTARQAFPGLRVEVSERTGPEAGATAIPLGDVATAEAVAPAAPGILVISHVLNELNEAGGRALRESLDRADAVLWVEPGTHADSRALIAMREALREQFVVVAPCTHQAGCGLRAAENERHWCHHFAPPPPGLQADGDWVRFAQRAGIDLRSVPYSFLVLERRGLRARVPGVLPDGWSRILGGTRIYKGYAKVLGCQADGVRDRMLQKRDAPELFKALKAGRADPLHRWDGDGERIVNSEPFIRKDGHE